MFTPGMKRAQDTDLWFRVAYQYPKVGYISVPLAIYHMDTPYSSMKINDKVDFVVELISRHLELSKELGRQEAFAACAAMKLQTYIRQYLKESRRGDARVLLRQFKEYLPIRFRRLQVETIRNPESHPHRRGSREVHAGNGPSHAHSHLPPNMPGLFDN